MSTTSSSGLEGEHQCSGSVSHLAAPFLFPCTIEYCLVCSAVLYEMYEQLGRTGEVEARHRRYRQDREERSFPRCHRAQRALFVGIVVLVLAGIVSAFVLSYLHTGNKYAIYAYHTMKLMLLFMCLGLVGVAFFKMRSLGYKPRGERTRVEAILSMIGFVGVLAYNLFILVSSIAVTSITCDPLKIALFVIKSIVELFEGTLQTALILDGAKRFALNNLQVNEKPGRACLTVLIIANLTLWVIESFKV